MTKHRRSSEPSDSNEVGYCRPPKHSRFKPGQSGNPKGRPKGKMNLASLVQRLMNERVEVRQGNKIRRMSKLQAVLEGLFARAAKGDPKATPIFLQLANEHLPTPPEGTTKIEVVYIDPPGKKRSGTMHVKQPMSSYTREAQRK